MNHITIFHYHLLPGGVTNVIQLGAIALIRHFPNLQLLRIVCGNKENTEAVQKKIEREIDSSGLTGGPLRFEICVDPQINYLDIKNTLKTEEITDFTASLCKKFGDSFWWIHNYQIGKNPLLTAAVMRISNDNPEQKMLLQIHDFPECARYLNLEKLKLAGVRNPYPVSGNTAYCLINSRDKSVLEQAGIPENKIFLLNNPVENETYTSTAEPQLNHLKKSFYEYFKNSFPLVNPEAKMIFYPVRTIRRKNILEAGLTAAISEEPVNLIVSLPGVSAQEKEYSDICMQCFKNGLIPGIWGSGVYENKSVPTYPQMLQICDLILSSSVQEGFGYLFINAVQLGIPLTARYLDILDGIKEVFPKDKTYFYSQIMIPIDHSDTEKIKERYNNKLKTLTDYISPEAISAIHQKTDNLTVDGTIDFSFMPVEIQLKTLQQIKTSEQFRSVVRLLNDDLMVNFYNQLDNGRYPPSENMDNFSLKAHADMVATIIDRLYSSKNDESKPATNVQQKLLNSFAEPEYMRLLYDF